MILTADTGLRLGTRGFRAFAGGALCAAWCAAGFWLAESVPLVRSSAKLGIALERALACAGLTVLWAAPLACAFGAACALAAAPRALPLPGSEPGWLERVLGHGRDAGARVPVFCSLLVLFAGGSYVAANWAITSMHQVVFMALGIAVLELLLLGAIALAYLPIFGLVRLAVEYLARVAPRSDRVLERPGRVLFALGALAVTAVIAVLVARWETAQYLPWTLTAKLGCALAFGGAYLLLRTRIELSRRRARIAGVVAAVLAGAGLLVLVRIDPARSDSAQVLQAETLSGPLGQRVLFALFDFDGDRHLGFAGGGDCAPHDARVHPGALDVIGNGVDEDCDGEDAKKISIARGLYKYPLPDGYAAPQQIFLITIDALQHHRIFAQDSGRAVAPTLDALARRSVYFDAAFSGGAATKNAFPSMFTSRWDSQVRYVPGGKSPHGIDSRELLLAEVLHAQQFDTLAVLPNVYFFPRVWKGMTDGFQQIVELPGTSRFRGGIHNAGEVRKAAIEAIGTRDPQAALFAWVHFFDAHAPYSRVSERGIGPFADDKQGEYDSEVALIDRELGKLLEFIDQRAFSNPLLIITSDHGTSFDPRHVRPYGEDVYADIVRVPLIVNGRGFAPRRVSTIVSTMDIAPTIANLLGIDRKLPYEGVSLVPELTTGSAKVKRVLHQQLWAQENIVHDEGDPLRWASVNDERYHLIDDREHDHVQLYDWRKDPFEREDLSRAPAHAKAQRRLVATLSQLLAEIDNDGVRSETRPRTEVASKSKAKRRGAKSRPKPPQEQSDETDGDEDDDEPEED